MVTHFAAAVCASLVLASSSSAQATGRFANGPPGDGSPPRLLAADSPWDNPNAVGKPTPPLPAPRVSIPAKRKKPVNRPRYIERPSRWPAPARPAAAEPRSKPVTRQREATSEGEEVEDEVEVEEETSRARRPVARRKKIVDDETTDARPKSSRRDDGQVQLREREHEEGEEEAGEEEEEAAAATDVLAAIAPRAFSVEVQGSVFGRSFRFDAPLQSENSFLRVGVAVRLEAYPFMNGTQDFYRKVGLAVLYGREMGQAAVPQINGSTISFPVVQGRWRADLRYPLVVASSFVIIPAVGYGMTFFDLKRDTPINPSACPAGTAEACLPDISFANFVVDLHLRYALTQSIALSLSGGYLLGSTVSRNAGNIASEAAASASGYHAELSAAYLTTNWLAIVAEAAYLHYSYSFMSTAVTYRSANETYYGATMGLRIFTR